jgi:hypothetical protein
MKNKDLQISKDELLQAIQEDVEQVAHETVKALNEARDGYIIPDSEDIVRDALAEFRKRVYQKAIALKTQAAQAAFSPSEDPADTAMEK